MLGVWQKDKDSGFYTVLVYSNGLDHGSETIRVLVKKVHTSSKGISEFEIIKILIGLDINMRVMDDAILRHLINGTVKVLQEAKLYMIRDQKKYKTLNAT